MICFLVLLFFFLYSFVLFLIDDIYILIMVFLFNFIISLLFKVKLKKHISLLVKNVLFVFFIVICNLLFNDINESIKVGLRLFLVIDYTYIMSIYFDTTKIRLAFKYMFYPLKVFKVDIDNLTLIVAVSLAFIPLLKDEIVMIRYSLKSKGFNFKLLNIIRNPHIYLLTFFNNLFDRVDELEISLKLKGF